MRTPLGLAVLAGAVLAGVTCTEPPTAPLAPSGSTARLALAPTFSREASAAWQSLAAFNLTANNVHIILKRPGPPEVVLKDTVVTLASGQVEISIELTVPINGPEELLGASIQVRDGTQVLFEGSSVVRAVRAGTPGGPSGDGGQRAITVAYVGPGAAARAIRIAPRDQVVATGASIAFSVTATDASGTTIAAPPILWRLSDPALGAIGGNDGAFTAGTRRGVVTVRATTPSAITDQVTIGIVPPAQRIVTIGGDGQEASAGRAVTQPFVVEVQAADGLPVPGVAVTFSAAPGASITPASGVTDANGRASATMTVGRTAGRYTFTATAGALGSTDVTATATPAPASAIAVVSGSGQRGPVNSAAADPLVVRVTDEFGAPAAGAPVAWTIASGGGSLSSATTTTDADGRAQVAYSYAAVPGASTVTATVTTPAGSSEASFTLSATPERVAALSIVSGSGQQGTPNAVLLPFVVKATDALGNPAPGFPITWTSDGGSLSEAATITGADGTAAVVLTLGTTSGVVQVTAAAPASGSTPAPSVTFTATTTAGPAARLEKHAGDGQSTTAGTAVAIAPAVKVLDAFGNRVPGAVVTFAVTGGGGSITAASAISDPDGIATLGGWTLGGMPGANTLTASSGTLAVTFNATGTAASGPPAQLIALNGPTFSYIAGTTVTSWPQVRVVDSAGVPVAGAPVSVSVTDPSGAVSSFLVTANTSGVAELHPATVTSFGGAGTYAGVASIAAPTAAPVNFTIKVAPGAFANLVIITPPATTAAIDTPLAPQPVVRAADANGNGIAGIPVTASIVSGGGTFTSASATTVTTNAAGDAAFSGLAFASGSGSQGIRFTSGAITSATASVILYAAPPAGTTNSWTGAVSSDWHTAGNWSANRVPTAADTIWIPQQAPLGLAASGSMNYGGITLSANAVVGAIHAIPYSIGIDVKDFELHVTGRALDMGGSSITSSTGRGSVRLTGGDPVLNVYDLPAMSVYGGARVAAGTEPWVNGNLSIFGGTFALEPDNYLDVEGTLRLDGVSAALKMTGNSSTGPSSSVYVYGSFIANGAASDTTLRAGYLYVEGDVRQSGDPKSFAPGADLYVSMGPQAAARISFTDFTNSKFQDLDIHSPYAPTVLRAAMRPATPLPARLTLRREAMARSEARATTRRRERRAARAARGSMSGLAALTVSPGVNFETSATIAGYLYLDAPLAILNSGSTVNAAAMYVNDNAAFEIAPGAAMHVADPCGFSSAAPTVPAGICPNPQYPASVIEPAGPGSDLFVAANGTPFTAPTGWGVRVSDSRPAPMSGTPVGFSIAINEGDACTFGASSTPIVDSTTVNTDTTGLAAMPLRFTGNSGSCVIQAVAGTITYLLRAYAVPGPSTAYKVFIGASSGAWSDGNNWVNTTSLGALSQSAPQPGDRVFVTQAGMTRHDLHVDVPSTVAVVRLGDGVTLGLGTATLTVTDSITGGAVTGGTGSVLQLAGTNQAIGTSVTGAKLVFGTPACSTQSFQLVGDVTGGAGVDVNCPVDLNGYSLSSGFDLTTANIGSLTMGSASTVTVVNDAVFGGAAGNVTGGTITVGGNLAVTTPGALQLPAATTLMMSATTAKSVTLPATAGATLGGFHVSNPAGVRLGGAGEMSNLYLYGGGTLAQASKLTIAAGAALNVTTRADVNQWAVLTIDGGGSLSVPLLSIGPDGSVVANGSLTVADCQQGSQVTGPGKPASCSPPQ